MEEKCKKIREKIEYMKNKENKPQDEQVSKILLKNLDKRRRRKNVWRKNKKSWKPDHNGGETIQSRNPAWKWTNFQTKLRLEYPNTQPERKRARDPNQRIKA